MIGVTVQLFEWSHVDVALECETFLGPHKFAAVQISPPNEHITGPAWWTRYQPVSYALVSRSGNASAFEDMVSRCFVCNLDRSDFDREGNGWDEHIEEEHNLWQYLFYIVYLRSRKADEYSGLEDYVSACDQANEIKWFPLHRAMCLKSNDEDENEIRAGSRFKFIVLLNQCSAIHK